MSPRALSAPMFCWTALPRGAPSTTRVAPARLAALAVPSVVPFATTTSTSSGRGSMESAEATARPTVLASFKAGITTDTEGAIDTEGATPPR